MWNLKIYRYLPLFGALLQLSTCLYEDQIGKFDWRHQYVGKPLYMDFDHSAIHGKRVVMASEQNVVAMLNSKNGDILWRHIMEKGRQGEIDAVLQHKSYLVVVTGGGEFVRYFNMVHGDLVWEASATPTNAQHRAQAAVAGSEDDDIAVLSSSGVSLYNTEAGVLVWQKQLPNSENVKYTLMSSKGDNLVIVGISAGSQITMVTLKSDGTLVSQNSLPAAWVKQDTSCMIVGHSHLVCLDSGANILQSVTLDGGKAFKATLLQDLGLSGAYPSLEALSGDESTGTEFVLRLSQSHQAILSVQGNTTKLIKDLKEVVSLHLTKYDMQPTLLVFSRVAGDDGQLKGYDITTGAEIPDLSLGVTYPGHHGMPEQLAATLFRKKDGSLSLRAVVCGEDHSLALFQQAGRISWTREEALSSILSVELVDLPVSNIQAKMEEEFGSEQTDLLGMFVKRFTSQFEQLQQLILKLKAMLKTPRHHHHITEDEVEEEEEDDEDYLTRDNFNVHKIIVATTAAGKMFGLDSPTGRILWRRFVPDLVAFDRFGVKSLPLAVQRTTSHPPNLPLCTVLGRHKATGHGLLLSFNPISGVPTDDMPAGGLQMNYRILQTSMMAFMDEHFMHPLVILDHDLQFHVYPESANKVVADNAKTQYMFTVDSALGLLRGFSMGASGGKLVASEMWTVNMQKDTQTITNVVAKRATEHVHSQGIVLGDRSVLYKYLNPNLIVVTAEGFDAQLKAFLNVYLVDAVSGSIVFHINHKRAKGPIHVVHSENWVVYNYWHQKHRRTEVVVLELFEGAKQSNATVFSSLNQPPMPLVMRQAYIFPGFLSSMATTITEKGITSKHILIALESGGILELPKMLIDARRPLEPTQENREEGLVPYIPELPRPYEMIINYNQSVYNIRKIHTSQAGLESTSLVLAYGLDLFYTMITPSKMFDVLKEDFDYFFIGSVLISMILVSVLSQKLAARKALSRAWK